MLKYLIAEDTLFKQSYDSLECAIRSAGRLLERKNYILPAYSEAMVEMVRQKGPYIVIMPGIALAHARPDGKVLKNSIALVTCKDGVISGNTANDPVMAVFAIAAVTDNEHLILFRDVAKYIEKQENIEKLLEARCYGDLF